MALRSVNPATGKEVERFEEMTSREVEERLERAVKVYADWRETDFAHRGSLLRAAGELLRSNKRTYAEIMAREMGKPLKDGMAEAEKCAWACDYYADHAAEFLAPEEVETDAKRSFVRYDPLGPILAIMPWNYPFWQVFRFAAPALMAGNVGLLKHASNVPRSALTIESIFREAGYPEGAFQTLLIGSKHVEPLIQDPRIRAVTLTGSSAAGAKVAAAAGTSIKKTVLELGGSDPFVVLKDADLDHAARVGAEARCINAGQSCIAAKRFIVEDAVYDAFVEKLGAEMERRRVGDPTSEDTEIGPQARQDLMEDLDRQVRESVSKGAQVRLGGMPRDAPGYFYEPTVLADVRPGMPAYDEEIFGPVAAVVRVADEREAIRRANDTQYGLGASIWTQDLDRGSRLARDVDAGMVFVNGLVKSDPRLPFGGVKRSGYGRELGRWGIREFVNTKTVWVGE